MAARNPPAPRLIVVQPPVAYRVQPPLVIDASVIGALLFDEPERDQAEAWMQGKQLFAPHLLDYELANVALNKRRKASTPRRPRQRCATMGVPTSSCSTPIAWHWWD